MLPGDELYRYQKKNKVLPGGGQVVHAAEDFISAAETHKLMLEKKKKESERLYKCYRLLRFGKRKKKACRSVFPHWRKGKWPVLTLFSARANNKAAGEAGGRSTAWLLVSSATACWSPCWGLPLPSTLPHIPSSTFLHSHLAFTEVNAVFFYPHPSPFICILTPFFFGYDSSPHISTILFVSSGF